MEQKKNNIAVYFENVTLVLLGALLAVFPLIFLSTTTDAFVLPKQLVLIGVAVLGLVLFAVKSFVSGKLRLRVSPFDLPVGLLLLVAFLSAIFSFNQFDSLIAYTPFLFLGVLYFVIVNTVKGQKQLMFLLSSLTVGAVLSSITTLLSFAKLYPLPFEYTHVQTFTTFGSVLDQALYLALVLPIAGYFGYSYLNAKKHNAPETLASATEGTTQTKSSRKTLAAFGIAFIFIALGLALSVYFLMTSQKPLILPFDTGLQTAMGAISQSNNIFKNILLGSGYGTYLNVFTQFKSAGYNDNTTLWAFTFFRSSSFVLELLATTGLLGLSAFGLLVYRVVKQKTFFLPLLLAILASIVLPFSFTLSALMFVLLALFAVVTIQNNPNKFGEGEVTFVGLKKGLLKVMLDHNHPELSVAKRRVGRALSLGLLAVSLVLVALPVYFTVRFAVSDMIFQQSLVAASRNDGLATYQLQASAITMFPFRDIYYRSFSQTNLALASALALNQPKGQQPSAEAQKSMLTLIQQSINAGRTATTISPVTSFNWNNLSAIYRSLIGFGQNADKFTILTLNQAIALDKNNPQQYIDLGGVYYQLGQYDQAIDQFNIAIALKKDYANAYYNLGHAYEEKGQYDQALTAYQAVKTLVADNAENTKKINGDIDILNKKKSGELQKTAQPTAQATPTPTVSPDDKKAIDVNKSEKQLPERNPQEKIPAPTIENPAPTAATR